jgi:hypothetical protein
MDRYSPIWSKIVDSSLWEEPDFVVKVFITMIAKKDMDDIVRGNAYNIARWSRKEESEVIEALRILSSPDTRRLEPQEFEGRRIEKCDEGYKVLKGKYYRDLMFSASRKEYKRVKQAEYRERDRSVQTPGSAPKPRFTPPTIEEVKFYAAKIGLPEPEAIRFHSYYSSNGWRVGRNPMKDWHTAMVGWKTRYEQENATNKPNTQRGNIPNPRNEGCVPNTTDYEEVFRRRTMGKQVAETPSEQPPLAGIA